MTKGEARRALIKISDTRIVTDEDAKLLVKISHMLCCNNIEECTEADAAHCDVFECPDEN